MIVKFSERFFCPAPWTHLYYHINNATPCHLIRNNLKLGPNDYLKSNWLKKLKKDFINGLVPEACSGCKTREDRGLKSSRGAFWKFYNVGNSPYIDISPFSLEDETLPLALEIRTTNLCNFKCRMCGEHSSSEIAKEHQTHSIPLILNSEPMSGSIWSAPATHVEELKQLCLNIDSLVLTGGEPLLIKEYYSILDFLIDNNLNEKITIIVYSNCSVYNPHFVDRLLKFKEVKFIMSIDGVGKTAEYQRHGTDWDIVKNNIIKFNSLPFNIFFNTAISSYVLLDMSSLAKFLMELWEQNNNIQTRCYTVPITQHLHHRFLSKDLREIVISQIDKAIDILKPKNFEILTVELCNIKNNLITTDPIDTYSFVNFTKDLDKKRDESFKKVFNFELV